MITVKITAITAWLKERPREVSNLHSTKKGPQPLPYSTKLIFWWELYNNPQQQPGNETLQFAFDMEVYRDKIYYVRMIVDGEIKINLTMQPKGSWLLQPQLKILHPLRATTMSLAV